MRNLILKYGAWLILNVLFAIILLLLNMLPITMDMARLLVSTYTHRNYLTLFCLWRWGPTFCCLCLSFCRCKWPSLQGIHRFLEQLHEIVIRAHQYGGGGPLHSLIHHRLHQIRLPFSNKHKIQHLLGHWQPDSEGHEGLIQERKAFTYGNDLSCTIIFAASSRAIKLHDHLGIVNRPSRWASGN